MNGLRPSGEPLQRALLLAALLLLAAGGVSHAQAPPVRPYESDVAPAASQIDAAVQVHLRQKGLLPANPCSDEVFLRRVYVDVIGTLPTPTEVTGFLADTRPNKRAAVIDALLQRDEFADYWALKWCDLLRVKSEFPINLWPNAVQAYHRWVREAIRRNEPLDQFARELLTTSGSNFRDPPVNFYRAVQGRDPASLAAAVALTFMGTRLDTWAPAQRANLAVFFSRVAYKKTDEWKEEIVYLNPAPAGPLSATLPDGKTVQIPPDKDPREVFADWLLAPGNPWFARSLANRAWYWFLGRGIVQEPDDIRPDNPPANPELLALLAQDLQDSHYDLRQLFRVILNSRTYQQSCLPRSDQPEAATLFAYYPVRRLDAEVLIDALCWIGGDGETYSSAIPEPYTFLPPSQRTISLADGSITSEFLETFGRPARDTGRELERNNQPTDAQRLYLLNSADVQRRIERSPRLAAMLSAAQGNRAQIISGAYLTVLSRYPTPAEAAAADAYFQTGKEQPQQALADLAWALVNTKEFMYRH